MALDTYTNLQTTVLTWLARPGDTLISGSIPDMILLFETEARDRLFHRLGETSATLTTVAGTATVALPTLWQETRELLLHGSPDTVLVYQTPEQMDEMVLNDDTSSTEDQPVFFTVEGPNFRFAPVPDAVYTISCRYLAGIQGLAAAPGGINWLLTTYPDAYLFGTLAEAEAFIGEDERAIGWVQRRDTVLERIIIADIRQKWSGSVLAIKSDTGNP